VHGAGEVTGYYRPQGVGFDGFVESGGSYLSFDFPGGFDTQPTDINDDGVIVGTTVSPGVDFIYAGGAFTPFNYPGNPGDSAFGLNDRGQIVGAVAGLSAGSLEDGYVATPVPEPGTLSLLVVAGLSCLAMARLRRW
jgi:hypothetical protein